jgi:hypothetical protein
MNTHDNPLQSRTIGATSTRGTITLIAIFYIGVMAVASAQIIPPPPSPVSKQSVARCNSRIGSYQKQNKQDPQQSVYSPQPGWTIVSYHVVDEGSFGNTSENWSSVPGNFTFTSNTDVTNTYTSAINLAISAGIKGKDLADLKAALNNSYNQYNAYHNFLASSNSAVVLKTNATGRGVLVDKGSQCAIHLDVVEVQADPNLKTPAQFRIFVMAKTQAAINAIKKRNAVKDETITR